MNAPLPSCPKCDRERVKEVALVMLRCLDCDHEFPDDRDVSRTKEKPQ